MTARRRFGQNFLVDRNVVDRIVAAVAPRSDETIVEIGSGQGALTARLLETTGRVVAIEESPTAPRTERVAIRRNVEALGLTGVTKIWRRDATKFGPAGTLLPFALIFCDPPYGRGLGEQALTSAVDGGWADKGAVAVLEERADTEIVWPVPFVEIDRRRYGETQIAIAGAGV